PSWRICGRRRTGREHQARGLSRRRGVDCRRVCSSSAPRVETGLTPEGAAARSRNLLWVVVWVGLGIALGLWVLATEGSSAAAEYYAAYLLEKSLSVDNIFVFDIILSELPMPPGYQHRVLRYGIAG